MNRNQKLFMDKLEIIKSRLPTQSRKDIWRSMFMQTGLSYSTFIIYCVKQIGHANMSDVRQRIWSKTKRDSWHHEDALRTMETRFTNDIRKKVLEIERLKRELSRYKAFFNKYQPFLNNPQIAKAYAEYERRSIPKGINQAKENSNQNNPIGIIKEDNYSNENKGETNGL